MAAESSSAPIESVLLPIAEASVFSRDIEDPGTASGTRDGVGLGDGGFIPLK